MGSKYMEYQGVKKPGWKRKAAAAEPAGKGEPLMDDQTNKQLELLERIALAVEHTASFYGFKPKPEPAAPATEEPAAPE